MFKNLVLLAALTFTLVFTGCSGEDGDSGNESAVGAAAHDILSSESYRSLVIEVHAVAGFEPTSQSLDKLKSFLAVYLDKPEGIRFVMGDAVDSSLIKSTYTRADIEAIEQTMRLEYPTGTQYSVLLLFLNGADSEDKPGYLPTLGYAVTESSIAVFEAGVRANSGSDWGKIPTTTLEATVLAHEFGHLLGLVNRGSEPQSSHEDTQHKGHCSNPKCLMHWMASTSAFSSPYGPETIPPFDSACLDDLRANGGL